MREDPLAELLLALELVVQRDVADGGGQMRREVEERLGLAAPIHRAHQRLPDGENRDELPVRQERHGQDALKQLQLARDLRVVDVVKTRRPSLGGEPAGQALPGVQAHRFDDRSGEPAMGRDAVFLRVGIRQ